MQSLKCHTATCLCWIIPRHCRLWPFLMAYWFQHSTGHAGHRFSLPVHFVRNPGFACEVLSAVCVCVMVSRTCHCVQLSVCLSPLSVSQFLVLNSFVCDQHKCAVELFYYSISTLLDFSQNCVYV